MNGNTTDSGSVIRGSSPLLRALTRRPIGLPITKKTAKTSNLSQFTVFCVYGMRPSSLQNDSWLEWLGRCPPDEFWRWLNATAILEQ